MFGSILLWVFGGLFLFLILWFLFRPAKEGEKQESPYAAGIQISKNGTSSVVDVGAYFGSIASVKGEDLRIKEKASNQERTKKMRAERVMSLTITIDGASAGINTPEDLVRYLKNVPEGELRKLIDFNKDSKKQ